MSASLEQENEVIETTENNDSPVQTVDIALASEPGLDRASAGSYLQAFDQVLRPDRNY